MSTVVEIKKAIEKLAPPERDDLARWFLGNTKPKSEVAGIHPDVLKMAGLIPKDMDVEDEFKKRQINKHR